MWFPCKLEEFFHAKKTIGTKLSMFIHTVGITGVVDPTLVLQRVYRIIYYTSE